MDLEQVVINSKLRMTKPVLCNISLDKNIDKFAENWDGTNRAV